MFTDAGNIRTLSWKTAQLAGCKLALTTTNVAEGSGVTLGSLTIAAWAGYATVTLGSFGTPTTVGGRAQSQPVTTPSFTNTSGSPQDFYGVVLYDPSDNTVLDYTLLGHQILVSGEFFNPPVTYTEKQE